MNIRDEVEILKFMLALSDFSKTRAFMQISCVAFAPDIEIDPTFLFSHVKWIAIWLNLSIVKRNIVIGPLSGLAFATDRFHCFSIKK